MTKFSSARDAGYISVSNQLWLWVETIQKEADAQVNAASHAQASAQEIRERRIKMFDPSGSQYFGSVNSGGGPVFQGDHSFVGHLTFHNNPR